MSSGQIIVVNADGGSRGNPGPAGYGAVVYDESGLVLAQRAKHIGTATNNVAEYKGLIAGLEVVAEHFPMAEVLVRMDSKLVVEQMTGRWKIKHPAMRELALQARELVSDRVVQFQWVPRAENSDADELANAAMDGGLGTAFSRDFDEESQRAPEGEGRAEPQVEVEPVTVAFIRHGHSARDEQKIRGGQINDEASLTSEGVDQVRQAGRVLQNIGSSQWADLPKPSLVVSSPRQRTRETAREAANTLSIAGEARLIMENFRDAQGASLPEIGERVRGGLEKLSEDYPGQTVVVASHGKAIKAAVGVTLHLPESTWVRFRTPLASVTLVQYRSHRAGELVASSIISS